MDADWAYVLQMAIRHSLVPLLYRKLRSQFRTDIPESVLLRLRNLYFSNFGRNVLLTRELLRVSNLLRKAGIPCIPFKGPVLASTVYGDVGLRQFDDLDILVPREHIAQVKRLLSIEGYRLLFPVPPRQETFFLRSHYEHAFQRQDREVMIDIHWASTLPHLSFMLGFEQLWERSRNALLEGQEIRTLAPEDLLPILCAHGCKHHWGRLSWIADVAGLVSLHPSLNLLDVVATSEKVGSRRMVCLALHLASDLLQAKLPDAILELINQDHKIRTLASRVYQHLFRLEEPVAMDIGSDINPFYIQTMVRKKDQIMPFVAALFIPTSIELNLFSLPASLFFLYSFLRPLRLATKYAAIFLEKASQVIAG
jgi:hypothetical protein